MINKILILDGCRINSKDDFHKQISKLLEFGPYYGENLDALWDMMSAGVELNVFLRWIHSHHSKQALGNEYYESILSIFNDVKKHDKKIYGKERFDFSLE